MATHNTKPTENKLDLLVESHEARQYDEQEQLIALRPLIMCGIPLRRIKEASYVRKSGPYVVELISSSALGVPYGQDRLIPIFLATLFLAQGCPADNTVRFLYARDILNLFGLPLDGKTYRRLREGFQRWQATSIRLELAPNGHTKERQEGLTLMPESRLWFHHTNPQKDELPNQVTLSSEWADEIRQHPIPADLQTVKAFTHCPGALDFYLWQIWRSYSISEDTPVPLEGKNGLFAQVGCLSGQPTWELKRLLKRWQQMVKMHWRDCPNALSEDEKFFVLHPCRALGNLQPNRFLLRVLQGYQKLSTADL
jgi:replication initiator protein